jgi:hypothetical protein
MGIDIGRLGYIALAIEDTPFTGESTPDVFLNYSGDPTLRERHEPLPVEHSLARRELMANSFPGKKWGEGDVPIHFDIVKAGYLFKMALGDEVLATGTPNVHTLYPTVSGNTPRTATLWYGRSSNDVQKFVGATIDTLEMTVADGLAGLTASFQSKAPAADSAPTLTTTSGTIFGFKDYTLKFGTTLANAAGQSATPANEFRLSIQNNIERLYRSGSNDVSTIRTKNLAVEGSYTLYFDSTTDRDAFMNLTKRALIATFTGNTNESVALNIARIVLTEAEISTGLDDFFIIQGTFQAELDTAQVPNLMNAVFSNGKATVY